MHMRAWTNGPLSRPKPEQFYRCGARSPAGLPATFSFREAAEAGALMSYGPSIGDAYRQWAVYAARIRSSLPASENLHKSRHCRSLPWSRRLASGLV